MVAVFLLQSRHQPLVDLNAGVLATGSEQMRRQHTKARPDFDDALISIGQDGGYNFAHDIFVVQKILPEAFSRWK